MINESVHAVECKCLSWKPIFAGALVIIGLSFLLNLFSVAIGLTAFTTASDGVETLALGGLLAAAFGIVVSMFAAGWLSGYLGQRHCSKAHLGALYGFLAWCVALIFMVFFAQHIHEYVSFYGHFISGSADIQMTSGSANNAIVATGDHVGTKGMVLSAYIIFCLFFLSAFACCLGGHCGMRHVCRKTGTC
jgi:hypothetical protein